MVSVEDVIRVVESVLHLGEGAPSLNADSQLLGALPEFDSMAVVGILTQLEEEYGVFVEDDDVTAEAFTSVGSLHAFLVENG